MPSTPLRRATYVTNLDCDSVRDHCHITGKYRGAAHTACSLKLRLSPKTTTIPVVFHNLRGYDSHLLMQAISKVEGRVHCIQNNTEKYISFSLGQLRFIDSVQFLLASLDRLVAANPPEAFRITAKHEPDTKRLELLLRKGMIPTSTWTAGTASPKPNFPRRRPSTVNSLMRISATRTTPTRKRSGKPLGARPWANTATCTAGQTCCFWQMSSRCSGRRASTSMAWTRLTTIPARAFRGTPCSRRPASLYWEGDARGYLNGLEALRQSQQSSGRGLRPGEAQYPHLIPRCEQSLRLGYESVSPHQRLSVGGRLPTTRKNHRRASGRWARGLHTWGGPGVPRVPTRCPQCISAGARVHGGGKGVDVGVSAQPPRRWGGANRGWEAGPQPPQQEPLRAQLSESAAVHVSGPAPGCGPSRPPVRPKPLDGAVHPKKYWAPEEGNQRLRDALQADE